MTQTKTTINRRSFLKASAMAGGGMMLSFSWFAPGRQVSDKELIDIPDDWFEFNSYIKIGGNGAINLMSPNPEFGSNVMTSMPMILAEELDVDWKNVIVEQADFFPERFDRQFTGGSQGIRTGWKPLRTAGATARQMLVNAAAQKWNVPSKEISTEAGTLYHKPSGKKAGYGEVASIAAGLPIPAWVKTKDVKDFKIVGTSRKNVEGKNIVTGKPLFGIDYKEDGMLIAMTVHPPFGMNIKSVDDTAARSMPGIRDIFTITPLTDDYIRNMFDTTSFPELAVVVGRTTWEVLNAKKILKVEYGGTSDYKIVMQGWRDKQTVTIPGGVESTPEQKSRMMEMAKEDTIMLRKDGNPEQAFKTAARVLERTYTAPYLAHNPMEPVNCFANVTENSAELYGPMQAPEFIMNTLSARLGLSKDKIHIRLARMGGGFGVRAYGHHMVEAAIISQKVKEPVKLVYTREDDMTYGIYRPTYSTTYRAVLDSNNNLIAFHVRGGGMPENAVFPDRFPAGAVDNYLAEGWSIPSNITIGAFRAPRSNFAAAAEQSFLDELAELAGKDPIDFRLELLERAKEHPVGERNDYDADRYAGVIRLVKEKSGWGHGQHAGLSRGVSAYFCHNSYVAHVVDLKIEDGMPAVQSVTSAVDCGIVINVDAARNMVEGAVVDGIGNSLFGEMTFKYGVPEKSNFDRYRMIRQKEAPKEINVHFAQNQIDPTGLGEPPFAPVFAAVANALYKGTGKRFYDQPFARSGRIE
jgi:isoquinoline 1-oxidoreductase subunit beta